MPLAKECERCYITASTTEERDAERVIRQGQSPGVSDGERRHAAATERTSAGGKSSRQYRIQHRKILLFDDADCIKEVSHKKNENSAFQSPRYEKEKTQLSFSNRNNRNFCQKGIDRGSLKTESAKISQSTARQTTKNIKKHNKNVN